MADLPIKPVQLRDGSTRYRFVVDVGRDPVTDKRLQKTYTFDSLDEAQAAYFRIKSENTSGSYIRPSKMTLGQFLDEWYRSATRDVERKTAANYRDALKPAKKRLGGQRLQRISEADIEDLVDWMLADGRTKGRRKNGPGLGIDAVRLTLGRLRAAFDAAVARQLIARNVTAGVKIPRQAAKRAAAAKAARRPWSAAEVQEFLSKIRDERLFAVVLLSLMGLRPAEVCGLRWSDVDLMAQRIAAGANTRTMVDGVVEEKAAKSAAGNRGLPLPAAVLSALTAFQLTQRAEQETAGDAYTDSGYVLVDQIGRPFSTTRFRNHVYRMMDASRMRRVRLYDARHACLTFLATKGVPDVVLAAWAGHADGGTLAKLVYVVPDESHLKVAADALGDLLG